VSDSDLVLYVYWEKTLLDLLERTEKFPKSVRHTLSVRIENLALDIAELVVRARWSKGQARSERLHEADERLTRLRLLLRIAHARRLLSPSAYAFVSERIDEAGRMLGAWKQHTLGRS